MLPWVPLARGAPFGVIQTWGSLHSPVLWGFSDGTCMGHTVKFGGSRLSCLKVKQSNPATHRVSENMYSVYFQQSSPIQKSYSGGKKTGNPHKSVRKRQPNRTKAEDSNRCFTNEDIHITSKHMKTLSVIRELGMKPMVTCYRKPMRTASVRKAHNTSCWQRNGAPGTLRPNWLRSNLVYRLWKTRSIS